MDSFTRMGEAMLLAAEGQQRIARALVEALGRGVTRLRERVRRSRPNISHQSS
jgi:hypothetical protein